MLRGLTLFLLASGMAGLAHAAPSPATPAAARAAAAPAPAQGNPRVVMSPEGNAIARQLMGPDPRIVQLKGEIDKVRDQKLQLVRSPNPDIDALEKLFRREESLQLDALKFQNDRFVALLRALPVADRAALLQTLANPVKFPSATTPAQPAKPN